MEDTKVRENRARRAAKRQGLVLHKSPVRDPRAIGYQRWNIADAQTDAVLAGGALSGYSMTLDEVEAYLAR